MYQTNEIRDFYRTVTEDTHYNGFYDPACWDCHNLTKCVLCTPDNAKDCNKLKRSEKYS